MNSIFVALLFKAVILLTSGNLFDLVKQLVIAEAGTVYVDIPAMGNYPALTANQQRKLAVTAKLYEIKGDLQSKIKSISGWLISALIDAAVGKLQTSGILASK